MKEFCELLWAYRACNHSPMSTKKEKRDRKQSPPRNNYASGGFSATWAVARLFQIIDSQC